MPPLKKLLPAMLTALLSFSIACTHEVQVPVPIPAPACDLGYAPVFPETTAKRCDQLVCLPPAEIAAVWGWAREMQRRDERARVCLDGRSVNPAPVTPSEKEVRALLDKLIDPRLNLTVEARDCTDEENGGTAWYFYGQKRILLCNQALADVDPGYVRFVIAHELSHAYIEQLDLPITGSHEAAADELAIFLLVRAGLVADVVTASKHYGVLVGETFPGYYVHPTNEQRFHNLRCLSGQAQGKNLPLCFNFDWARVKRNWTRILK